MTNLDNIRQMNSEELAEKLCQSGMCGFCTDNKPCAGSDSCYNNIKAWLEQEATPTLTDDEKVILRNVDKKFKWIARDGRGSLCIYETTPQKKTNYWGVETEWQYFCAFKNLFQFIQWSDDEPYEISKLLGDEDLLGKEGICEGCGENGTYQYDPYDLEIHDKEEIVCLCDECYQNRAEEI